MWTEIKANKPSFHFLGISGTAMGSVAAMLYEEGFKVSGSDENVYPPMSTFLESKGISFNSGYSEKNLPFSLDTTIVVGNTISRGNLELEMALEEKRLCVSLPEILKFFFLRKTKNLVVSGTHGKTTTSSLLAWIFEFAGLSPSFMIGGIPNNLGVGCRKQKGDFWILEGDEYDTAYFDKRSKFLHYLPELLIINNVEFDHADIYEDLAAIKKTFSHLVNIVPRNGMILVNGDDENALDCVHHAQAPVLEIGFSMNAGVRIKEPRYLESHTEFEMYDTKFHLPMFGKINVHNAAMAIAAAHIYQIPLETISEAIKLFQGIKRRQEVRGEAAGVLVIDDFGHHPTAISETLKALRHRYPQAKLWALFEPRSNTTRRAVFQDKFPQALSGADEVYVGEVAMMEKLAVNERLNTEKLVQDIKALGKNASYGKSVDEIVEDLAMKLSSGDVVIVFSNGSFGGIHQKIIDALAS